MQRILVTLALLLVGSPAFAQPWPVPAAEWDEATRLTLAQVMVGEADWHEPDHIAIAFVLARRWQQYRHGKGPISFRRYMQLYSSTMKVDTERARWVRGLPWGPLDGPHGPRWREVQRLVAAWGQGKVQNPCPNAEHWGGAMDRPGRAFEPVTCGLTKNIFYAARDKRLLERRADKADGADKAAKQDAPRRAAKQASERTSRVEKRLLAEGDGSTRVESAAARPRGHKARGGRRAGSARRKEARSQS